MCEAHLGTDTRNAAHGGPAPWHEDACPKKTYLGRCPAVTAEGTGGVWNWRHFCVLVVNSPNLSGVMAGEELVLASWPWTSTLLWQQGTQLCGEPLLHSHLAHQRQEVTGLREHSTLVADLALEAQPSRKYGCEPYLQASLAFQSSASYHFWGSEAL